MNTLQFQIENRICCINETLKDLFYAQMLKKDTYLQSLTDVYKAHRDLIQKRITLN